MAISTNSITSTQHSPRSIFKMYDCGVFNFFATSNCIIFFLQDSIIPVKPFQSLDEGWRRGWDFPTINFLTEIFFGPALVVLALPCRQTRTSLRASNPNASKAVCLLPSSFIKIHSERVGFEPTRPRGVTVFETVPLNQTPAPLHESRCAR